MGHDPPVVKQTHSEVFASDPLAATASFHRVCSVSRRQRLMAESVSEDAETLDGKRWSTASERSPH